MNSVEFTLSRREARIREWMLATVSNGGIERLDDLHVDKIDEDWAQRTNWVDAGFTAYRLAIAVKDKLGLDVTVALGFSLVDDETGTKIFETKEEFDVQLDWSPPSLYLFNAGDDQHLSSTAQIDPLPKSLISKLPEGSKSFLLQWISEDGHHRRSVFVETPRNNR
jgi:hypothetical protein